MPMLIDIYPEVHDSYEEVKQQRARLQAEMAKTEARFAAVAAERASTVQWMLQCVGGPDADGHAVMHALAERLQAAHLPAAAATFMTEAMNQQA